VLNSKCRLGQASLEEGVVPFADAMAGDEALVAEWKTLYATTLPALAKSRDPAQPKWPVSLDHCFARIILDNTVGRGSQQWDEVISKPAVKNMNDDQLRAAIELGQRIQRGEINLCELDQISLMCRGKNEAKYANNSTGQAKKRKTVEHSDQPTKTTKVEKQQSMLDFGDKPADKKANTKPKHGSKADDLTEAQFREILEQIQKHSSLTPYRRRLYTILLSVPRGRYTTYAAMSDYLNSSARAVGNGIRNNPFAPECPCHRVLAADGSIGGFHGDWGKEGKYANDKLKLLREEGVRFDVKGKVVGKPFRDFHEFEHLQEELKHEAA
jgi:O-6-methylguanine DNA methyltransferase